MSESKERLLGKLAAIDALHSRLSLNPAQIKVLLDYRATIDARLEKALAVEYTIREV